MKLYAISDLHLGYALNREAFETILPHPNDWLILAGDIGEKIEHLRYALARLTRCFAQVIWVPGNHDLWSIPNASSPEDELRGEAKYSRLVAVCREYGVLTPEDPYVLWPGAGKPTVLAPLFLLYDYSFRPADVAEQDAVSWAEETEVVCTDEYLLHPDPYPSRAIWCRERCLSTEQRLQQVPATTSLILINHFPLKEELVKLPRIPRFSLWCGTRRTANWHTRFSALAVVYGHLHIPTTRYRDGVRFEEVSFGYPWQRSHAKGIHSYLRQILPFSSTIPTERAHLP